MDYENVIYKVKFCHPFLLSGCFLAIFRNGVKNNIHYRRPCMKKREYEIYEY